MMLTSRCIIKCDFSEVRIVDAIRFLI